LLIVVFSAYISMKIVVFDLDETLGYFTQFGIFWDSLVKYCKHKNKQPLTQLCFIEILDLYPEFLRPNIINILNYLKDKKKSKCCHKMMIYTNNNGSREWVEQLINYFEDKINYKLINQTITAFKINGKRIEMCRTTHQKTHKDLVRCTKIPLNSHICFLDDAPHPKMIHERVYYINVKPYYCDLMFGEMVERFKHSDVGRYIIKDDEIEEFNETILKNIKLYNYVCKSKTCEDCERDENVGEEIIHHLKYFFGIKRYETRRMTRNHTKNKTRKR